MLTTTCLQTTLVTSWCTKENCTYFRVLPRLYYKNIMMYMVILARHIYKRWSWSNSTGWGWLMTYESTARTAIHVSFQIWHLKGSWTICSTTHTQSAMVVNSHQLHIWAAREWKYTWWWWHALIRFSKMVQLVPLQESDAHTIADKFLSIVVSQHGLPEYIISNHDPHFCGHFWDELLSYWTWHLHLVWLHTLRLTE